MYIGDSGITRVLVEYQEYHGSDARPMVTRHVRVFPVKSDQWEPMLHNGLQPRT